MVSQNIVSPDDQSATFVELFFDIVFVFSVTQVVQLIHHDLMWETVGQGILVFWMVWWAWTQFTWALNAADTTNQLVEIGTLIATGVAFFMAAALPDAFHGRELEFAIPYVLVRVIGLGLYAWVASADASQAAAVRKFGAVSLSGLVAVLIGGLAGGTLQYVFWGLAIGLDIAAAVIGGRMEGWNIHPEHFGERHGLFVIIALGETLIIAAGGVAGVEWTTTLIGVAILAVGTSCGLWWSYFAHAKQKLDHALENCRGAVQSMMGRDVFSLAHFPMLFGVIAYAVAVEEAVLHPNDPLSVGGRLALAAGLVLFVGGMAGAIWRATSLILISRIAVIGVTGIAILGLAGVDPIVTLAIAFGGVVVIGVLEISAYRRTSKEVAA